jgi:hypothetical protein
MDLIVVHPPADAETLPAIAESADSLPALIQRAATALAAAKSAAEILEVKDMASVAFDLAARFARADGKCRSDREGASCSN